MSYEIIYQDKFLEDLKKHSKSGQKKLVLKIQQFIAEIRENPRSGTGQPEQLKFMERETWSRRVNSKHRFTYQIEDDDIMLLSAYGHYSDK